MPTWKKGLILFCFVGIMVACTNDEAKLISDNLKALPMQLSLDAVLISALIFDIAPYAYNLTSNPKSILVYEQYDLATRGYLNSPLEVMFSIQLNEDKHISDVQFDEPIYSYRELEHSKVRVRIDYLDESPSRITTFREVGGKETTKVFLVSYANNVAELKSVDESQLIRFGSDFVYSTKLQAKTRVESSIRVLFDNSYWEAKEITLSTPEAQHLYQGKMVRLDKEKRPIGVGSFMSDSTVDQVGVTGKFYEIKY